MGAPPKQGAVPAAGLPWRRGGARLCVVAPVPPEVFVVWVLVLACTVAGSDTGLGGSGGGGSDTHQGGADTGGGAPTLVWERISFAGITAADQDAVFAWYGALGLEAKGSNWFGFADHASVEVFTGGTAAPGGKTPAQQSWTVGFQVPDLDAAVAELSAAGVVFHGDGEDGEGLRSVAAWDVEGNELRMVQVGERRDGTTPETLAWAELRAQDPASMTTWYADQLGLGEPVDGAFVLPGSTVRLVGGGTASDATKPPSAQPVVLGLEVPDLDDALEVLEQRGIETGEVDSWSGSGWPDERWSSVVDPEGNLLLVKQLVY